jgi:hypothetical protein
MTTSWICRRFLISGLLLLTAGCGYTYHLKGHAALMEHSKAEKLPDVHLVVGQRVRVVSQGLMLMKYGFSQGLGSEDPSIARVLYKNNNRRSGTVDIEALKPGQTTVHYINVVHSDSTPLRQYSHGSFTVIITEKP